MKALVCDYMWAQWSLLLVSVRYSYVDRHGVLLYPQHYSIVLRTITCRLRHSFPQQVLQPAMLEA